MRSPGLARLGRGKIELIDHHPSRWRFAIGGDPLMGFHPRSRFPATLVARDLDTGAVVTHRELDAPISGVARAAHFLSRLAVTREGSDTTLILDPADLSTLDELETGVGSRSPSFQQWGTKLALIAGHRVYVHDLLPPPRHPEVFDLDFEPFDVQITASDDTSGWIFASDPLGRRLVDVEDGVAVRMPGARWMADTPKLRQKNPGEPDGGYAVAAPDEGFVWLMQTIPRGRKRIPLEQALHVASGFAFAYVPHSDGRRMAIIQISHDGGRFGEIVQTVRFSRGTVSTVAASGFPELCFAITDNNRRIYRIDPSTLPLDGTVVVAPPAVNAEL